MATKSRIRAPIKLRGAAAKTRTFKPAGKGTARARKESAAVKRADRALGRGGRGVGRGTGTNSSNFGGG